MNWASARSSRAAAPQSPLNRAFAIFTARSGSSRPSASPTSSWGFGANPKARGGPQRRTSTLSSSPRPCGADSCGRLGSCATRASSCSSTCFSSASSVLMRSPTSRIRAISEEASSPRLLAWPIASEARLRSALRSSAFRMTSRREASRATTCFTSSAPPLTASARSTISGCSRISRRSSTALRRGDGRGALRLDAGDGSDLVVGVEVDDAHAHRVPALRGHRVGREADEPPLGGDDQHVVAFAHLDHADHRAVAAAGLDVDDPLAGPALQAVFVERRALAVAALGHGEDQRALLDDVGSNDLVALVDLDPAHAGGGAAHRAYFLF